MSFLSMIPTQTQPLSRASFFPAPQRRRVKEKSAKAQSLEALRESRRKTSSIIPLFMDNKARGNYSPTTPPTQLYTQINPTESLDSRVARIKEEGTNIERLVSDFDIEARNPAVATNPSPESLLGAGAAVAGGLFLLGQFIPGVAEVEAGVAAGDMLVATGEGGVEGAAEMEGLEAQEGTAAERFGGAIEGPVEAEEDIGGMEEESESRGTKRPMQDDFEESRRPVKKSSQKNPRTRPPQEDFGPNPRRSKRIKRPPLRYGRGNVQRPNP
tara:strand:+ start:241 stop:1050 length:810 start_codon:yes stop_codon:yes gene_type:complete